MSLVSVTHRTRVGPAPVAATEVVAAEHTIFAPNFDKRYTFGPRNAAMLDIANDRHAQALEFRLAVENCQRIE